MRADPDDSDETRRQLVGHGIRQARERRGWSQYALAAKADLSQGAITAYERGQRVPRWDELRRLARALGVNGQDIIAPMLYDLDGQATVPPGQDVHDAGTHP